MEVLTAHFIIRYFDFAALQGELCPRLFSRNRPLSGGRDRARPLHKICKEDTPGFLAPFLYDKAELNNGNGRNLFP